MIPEVGTPEDFKSAVLRICSTLPQPGEIFYIPVWRQYTQDPSLWVLDEGSGNEETLCFRRLNQDAFAQDQFQSLPVWRWEQMRRVYAMTFRGYVVTR